MLASLIAVFVHELGHVFEARRHGYCLNKITLYPYGGVLDGEDVVSKSHMTTVAISGPFANLVLALICISVNTAYPNATFFTTLMNANLAIFVFNLLPAFPLDGARVIISICKNEIRALKTLKIVGISCAVLLFVLFLISAFGKLNLTLGILSIFLLSGSISGTNREFCSRVVELSPLVKNYDSGVEMRRIAVSKDLPLAKLSGMLKSGVVTEFCFVDESGNVVMQLSEPDFINLVTSHASNKTPEQILMM